MLKYAVQGTPGPGLGTTDLHDRPDDVHPQS